MSAIKLAILFATCVLVVHAFPQQTISAYDESVLGPKECAKGPQYWCKDLKTAKQCRAVGHCIQTVWEKAKVKPDDSEICETCKKMVDEAREQLRSNQTGQEIKEVLEGTCRIYFPIKVLADQCIKFVDEFAVELIEMLTSRMDPVMICSTAGLCNSAKMKQFWEDIKIVQSKVSVGDDCQDCKTFLADVVRKLHVMSKEDVKNKMEEFCRVIGGAAGRACQLAISLDFNEIYTFLMNDLETGDLCKFADMCENEQRILLKLKSSGKVKNFECDFCVQIVAHVRQVILENSTKEEVHEVLLGLCKSAGKFKDQCIDFVNDYFNVIYDFISNDLDGQLICSALGICGNNNLEKIPLTPLMPSETKPGIVFTGDDETNVAHKKFTETKELPAFPSIDKPIEVFTKFPSSKKLSADPVSHDTSRGCLCVLCEYVLHDIQNILMNQSTEQNIKHAVEKVCSLAPKNIREQCTDFIEDYGDALIVLFAQKIDPSQMCVQLHLCNAEMVKSDKRVPPTEAEVPAFQLPPERLMPQTIATSGQSACMTCQYMMGLMDTLIRNNAKKSDLIFGLDNICHLYPEKQRDICDMFIEEHGAMIADVLERTEPAMICAIMGVCPVNAPPVSVPIEKLNMDKCDACVLVVDYLEKLLQNSTVDSDIAKALEHVCDIVPGSIKEMCKAYIEAYGPALIQMLAELKNSKQVCQAIELCDSPAGSVQILGGKKCTYGPAYWCKSIVHAQACKAEAHCKKHVWKAVQ